MQKLTHSVDDQFLEWHGILGGIVKCSKIERKMRAFQLLKRRENLYTWDKSKMKCGKSWIGREEYSTSIRDPLHRFLACIHQKKV